MVDVLPRRATAAVLAWTRRPGTGLALAGTLMFALLATAGTAGWYIVPRTAPPPVAELSPGQYPAGDGSGWVPPDDPGPGAGAVPSTAPPQGSGSPTASPSGAAHAAGRPADALAGWAVPIAARLDIPAVALQAYGYSELVLARTTPSCRLSWTTLAGIGKIESNHGRASGATLGVDGRALPPIIGLPLDGQDGRDAIPDTDAGGLDGDRTWDRAVGPLQFIPTTWQRYAVDADNDGVADPNDIDDAALAAGTYLCASGRDLSTAAGWYAAVMTYNAVRAYVGDVYDTANDYGIRSRG